MSKPVSWRVGVLFDGHLQTAFESHESITDAQKVAERYKRDPNATYIVLQQVQELSSWSRKGWAENV